MTILMMMIFIIPQSFFFLKMPFIAVVLAGVLVGGLRGHLKIRSAAFVSYYLIFCLIATIWSFIGLAKGNPQVAVVESLRVYVAYMVCYFALTIYVSNTAYQTHVDGIVIAGSLGIGVITALTPIDELFQLGWIPEFVKDEMFLGVGFHDGYIQMNNVNIGMLAFVVPYLLSRLFFNAGKKVRLYLLLGLIVAVISAIAASRRIIVFLIFIVPLLVYVLSFLTNQEIAHDGRKWGRAYFLLLLAGAGSLMFGFFSGLDFQTGILGRFMEVFDSSSESPRALQHAALLSGFYDSFVWGSGFGGLTEVVRSDERPWTYELTYSRLLFNGGVLGFSLIMLFFLVYLLLALRAIRGSAHGGVYIPLLVGFLSVSIAAASNPYLSSFDFIFCLSIIPLILNSQEYPGQLSTTLRSWG